MKEGEINQHVYINQMKIDAHKNLDNAQLVLREPRDQILAIGRELSMAPKAELNRMIEQISGVVIPETVLQPGEVSLPAEHRAA